MKNQLALILFIFFSLSCYSQISFEKGYYISNSDEKIECLIKNVDWNSNPTQFDYKISEDSEHKNISIKSVKEFGIYDQSRFVRYDVDIDRTINGGGGIGTVKDPVYENEKLFLKVLVEGKATLFSYVDGNFISYFFNKDNSDAEQLIFKEYTSIKNFISINESFKSQLWENLQCPGILVTEVTNLRYNKKELIKYFENYNSCIGAEYVLFGKKEKGKLFHLSLRPGLNHTSLTIDNPSRKFFHVDYGSKINFRFGIEAEFVMPFNKNKWSLLIEPTYQYFKSEIDYDYRYSSIKTTVADYKSIELPIGIRHYFFINEKSKIFLNGSLVLDFAMKSEVNNLEIKTGSNLAFGVGYNFNNKLSMELRYFTNRDLFYNYELPFTSEYETFSVIFGYTIF